MSPETAGSADTNPLAPQKRPVEVAKAVSPEVKVAAVQAILSEGNVEVFEILRDKQAETLALVQRLLTSAGISNFSLPVGEEKKDKIAVAPADAVSELSPETLELCLGGLEADYKNGIVVVDDGKTVDDFNADLTADKTAGTPWDTIKGRLLSNDSELLKKAARIQGRGQLVGVYPDGTLCIKDRGTEPVIYGKTAEGKQVTITTDTPNRADVMQNVSNGGQFADYWEIRTAVTKDGFTLLPDAPDYKKRGIVAAVEAITDVPFVRSENGTEWRSTILECGDVSQSAGVRVVFFDPCFGYADLSDADPEFRTDLRGAVRVLRG